MTNALFTARRDDGRAEWRVVFDAVQPLTYGEKITHDALCALLATKDRRRVYQAVSRANRKLWASEQKSLAVVPTVGYRVLKPQEHEIQANGYKHQARRKLDNAVQVMKATDLTSLDAKQRNWVLQVTAGMVLMARSIDEHASRLARHDDLIKALQERVEKLENK